MAYATSQDMKEVLGERLFLVIADRDDDEVEDSAALAIALDNASSFADSYISRWLPLPSSPPQALRYAVIHIAAYNLCGDDAPEELRKRFEDARRWLEWIACGKIKLFTDGDGEVDTSADDCVEFSGPGRELSRECLRGVF